MIFAFPFLTFVSLSFAVPPCRVRVFDFVPTVTTTVPPAGAAPRRTVTVTTGRVPIGTFLGAFTLMLLTDRGVAATVTVRVEDVDGAGVDGGPLRAVEDRRIPGEVPGRLCARGCGVVGVPCRGAGKAAVEVEMDCLRRPEPAVQLKGLAKWRLGADRVVRGSDRDLVLENTKPLLSTHAERSVVNSSVSSASDMSLTAAASSSWSSRRRTAFALRTGRGRSTSAAARARAAPSLVTSASSDVGEDPDVGVGGAIASTEAGLPATAPSESTTDRVSV